MNLLRVSTLALLFSAFLTISVYTQTTNTARTVYVNTEKFYLDKNGITKLFNAEKQLEIEFSAKVKELRDGASKLEAIAKELDTLRKLPSSQSTEVAFAAKRDEGENLDRSLKYKKEDLERAIAKRRDQVINPITREIGNAIDEFGAKNGYAAILDLSKMGSSGALMFLAPSSDVTKEFILFVNSKPTTATLPR